MVESPKSSISLINCGALYARDPNSQKEGSPQPKEGTLGAQYLGILNRRRLPGLKAKGPGALLQACRGLCLRLVGIAGCSPIPWNPKGFQGSEVELERVVVLDCMPPFSCPKNNQMSYSLNSLKGVI